MRIDPLMTYCLQQPGGACIKPMGLKQFNCHQLDVDRGVARVQPFRVEGWNGGGGAEWGRGGGGWMGRG